MGRRLWNPGREQEASPNAKSRMPAVASGNALIVRSDICLRGGPMYRIREVDGSEDEIADALTELHRLTFFDGAPIPPFDRGHWWLVLRDKHPVAFAGVVSSTHVAN